MHQSVAVEFLPALARRCREVGIQFACTPFYLDAVGELLPYVDFYKIASYELTHVPLLMKVDIPSVYCTDNMLGLLFYRKKVLRLRNISVSRSKVLEL